MNRQEVDVLNAVYEGRCMNQREIAQKSGHSLGIVNRSIKTLINDGYIDVDLQITTKGKSEFEKAKPQNAIILAAGYGMRMVPINTEVSKGLIEVDGEPLVERLIKQLHEAGIYEIYVVVGFLKEHYEYLIDEYQVKLVVNSQYKEKNNLYSLKKVEKYFGNSYIVPCDLWCAINPFRKNEFYSWYMVNEIMDENSTVRVNRKMELVASSNGGNGMVGISYIAKPEAGYIKERMAEFITQKEYDNAFWEECLWDEDKMIVQARVVSSSEVIEINTFEQLRDLDEQSSQLESEAIHVITEVLQADVEDITDITVLKKGMTNRSFLFSCKNDKYIM